jgi:hypothetical protein
MRHESNGTSNGDSLASAVAVAHRIEATAVYTLATATAALGLPKSSLSREIRQGRLRVSKRAGRYFILGSWLLEWLEGGERKRKEKSASDETVA